METLVKKYKNMSLRKYLIFSVIITLGVIVLLSSFTIWGCLYFRKHLLPESNNVYLTVYQTYSDGRENSYSIKVNVGKEGTELPVIILEDETSSAHKETKYTIQRIENSVNSLSPKRKMAYHFCGAAMIMFPFVFSIVGILLCGFHFYKRKLSTPLSLLSEATEQILEQNLDFSLHYNATDEMGKLCSSFEQMRSTLHESFREMWNMIEERKLLQASIAHDLRNPIAVIEGYTEYLQINLEKGNLNEKRILKIAGNLNLAAKRLERYTESVRTLNQMEDRAIAIILLFGLLIGYRIISQEYTPSVQEQYYQDIMMQLEGEITDEKEALILSEQERYDEAFSEIDRIDDLIANGEISESAGDNLKAKWYAVTYFYPSFERVLQQYQRICESGGNFIYDTGYLYLFGRMTNDYLIDLLLLSLCIVIAFSNTVAMEYQCGSWYLLSTTSKGKKKIICKKTIVCIIATTALSVIPIICRIINVSSTYPLQGLDYAITDIPCYQHLLLSVSVFAFIVLLVLLQMVSLIAVVLIVLVISYWRKNHIQTVFFSLLILVVPLILKLLGFSFAGWFSVYPIYSLTAAIS